MSDFEKEKWSPSTESLSRIRNAAIFYFAAGVCLAVLQFFARMRIIGLVAGGIVCALGIGWLMANNPNNKRTGALITGIGVLLLLSKTGIYVFMVLSGTLLNIAAISFLVLGVKNLINYFIAENKRF